MESFGHAQSEINGKSDGYIVGIGASAGGLEAVQQLLSALPPDTGFPFILVQHLSADYKSLLCEILSRSTAMPVIQAEEGMAIEPNHLYIIQPGRNLELKDGRLHLPALKEHTLNLPIDLFFRSLATQAGAHAIGIVLSGTGSDGSNGLKAIKENDGLTLVQDIESAKFDGMPKNAMRTGIVDAQMTPSEIAFEIGHIAASHRAGLILAQAAEDEMDEELLKKVYIILKKTSGINFSHYKRATVMRRLERRTMLTRKETLSDYVAFLYQSPDEVKTLSREILIGVTSFFRDPAFFAILKEKVIAKLVQNGSEAEPIRVWVAGCSTGEEAYSIAILFCEEMEAQNVHRSVKLFATDLDAEAIEIAGKGVYGDSIADAVSVTRLSKFFTLQGGSYTVKREVRKMIIFSVHNVFQDPPFGKLDLVSCRNLMIYFQPTLQNDMFSIFHLALKDRAFLFLGKSEAVGAFTDAFPVVDAGAKIFSHQASIKYSGAKSIPFLQTGYTEDDCTADLPDRLYRRPQPAIAVAHRKEVIETAVLERFLPGCLVVNDKNDLVYTFGKVENFVHIGAGAFNSGLYAILTDALKIPVSIILKEARAEKRQVQYRDICFAGERETASIVLTALPVGRKGEDEGDLYALVFLTDAKESESDSAVPYEADRAATQRIEDLEMHLQQTQEKLKKSIAEQDCVNEELQSTNEELLTANEELQSSNEELQSVNEELYTVNAEFQQKLTELSDLNDDIANFLSSTLIGIIFVDSELRIKRFTDYVTSEFNLMNHDIGRSVQSISYYFPAVDFNAICAKVLKTLVADDREIVTTERKTFLMRVAPYRSTEQSILGCVITLVDITAQKLGVAKLQHAEDQIGQMLKSRTDMASRTNEVAAALSASLDRILSAAGTALGEDTAAEKDARLADITKVATEMKLLTAAWMGHGVTGDGQIL